MSLADRAVAEYCVVISIGHACYADAGLIPGLYITVVKSVKVWSRPSKESKHLRTEGFDALLYVEEIQKDPPTCAEPSIWGRLCGAGWIVILNQAADGYLRARPLGAVETAKGGGVHACGLPRAQDRRRDLSVKPRIHIAGLEIRCI